MIHNGNFGGGRRDETQENFDHKSDSPTGLDSLLLIIMFIIMCGSSLALTLVGIVPSLILLVSFALSVRSGSIDHLRVAVRFLQLLSVIGVIVAAFVNADEYDAGENFMIAGAVLLSLMIALEFLWLRPLSRMLPSLRLFFMREKSVSVEKSARIMDRDGLAPFSVADELQKWAQLRNDGIVSESEFEAARDRILNGSR